MDIAEKLEQIIKFKEDLNSIIVSKGVEAKIKLTDIVSAINEIVENGSSPEIDEAQVVDKDGNIYDVNDDCAVYKDLDLGIQNVNLDCDSFLIYDADYSYIRKILKNGGLDLGCDGSGVIFYEGSTTGLDFESNNVLVKDDFQLHQLNLKDGNKGLIKDLDYPDKNATRVIDMPNDREMLIVLDRGGNSFQYRIVPFGTYVTWYFDSEDSEYTVRALEMEVGKTYKVTSTGLVEV